MSDFDVEVVNMVGSGDLGRELDLTSLSEEMGDVSEYEPEIYPGMYVRFEDDAPLITVYRTGKYIITGSKSADELHYIRDKFLRLLNEMDVIQDSIDDWFSVQNVVCVGELSNPVDLNALTIELGFENTEYEPEQFPGMVYRPEETTGVVLVFTSGKVVITGCTDIEEAQDAFDIVKEKIMSRS